VSTTIKHEPCELLTTGRLRPMTSQSRLGRWGRAGLPARCCGGLVVVGVARLSGDQAADPVLPQVIEEPAQLIRAGVHTGLLGGVAKAQVFSP